MHNELCTEIPKALPHLAFRVAQYYFYHALKSGWFRRELEQQANSMLFERVTLSYERAHNLCSRT